MQRNHRSHFSYIMIVFVSILVCTPLPAQNAKVKDDLCSESEQLFRSLGSSAGKVFRVTNTVVHEIDVEMKEFKKDIEECCPELYAIKDSLRVQTKRGLELCRREMHRGFRQGLRGDLYDPAKD